MESLLLSSSTVLTGLFVGAMLLIAVSLMPYWRTLAPTEYREWFVAHAGHLGRVMVPLGTAATLVALIAVAFAALRDRPLLGPAVQAACLLGVLLVYFAGNKPINDRLFTPAYLPDDHLARLRRHWAIWHWIRVGMGLVALGAAA